MFVSGGGKYEVRLVNPNGSADETMKEIASALDHLSSISTNIFESLKSRLDEQRGQLTSLTQRLTQASDQVLAIQGSQKAIRVLSPAKYPAELLPEGTELSFKPIVSNRVSEDNRQLDINKNLKRSNVLRFEAPIQHPNDLLACFHVRESRQFTGVVTQPLEVGLGKPPLGLDHIDSFLLFNSAQNPYEHYRVAGKSTTAGLGGNQQLKHIRRGEEMMEGLQQRTPQSTQKPPDVPTEKDDFYYSPSTLQIPDINVPEHLPDLPGIVENLDLSPVENSPFNMFAFQQPKKPISLETSPSSNSEDVLKSNNFLSPSSSMPTIQLQPQVSKHLVSTASALSSSVTSVQAPPPPPPPLPKEIETIETVVAPKKNQGKSNSGGVVVEDRSNLMAAIREAGGAGKAILKSAQDRKYEAKKKKQEEKDKNNVTGQSSDGLMSDLKNTLAMRRKGISGIEGGGGKQSAAGLGDIMQKLASTIPSMDDSNDFGQAGADSEDDDDWD